VLVRPPNDGISVAPEMKLSAVNSIQVGAGNWEDACMTPAESCGGHETDLELEASNGIS
jgi:hypothetical protein